MHIVICCSANAGSNQWSRADQRSFALEREAAEEGRMIPAAFTYHRPRSIAEAVALLGDLGEDARPLAGGHSLIPMMKLRLARPADLVDLRAIENLRGIAEEGGTIVIGAMTTQQDVIASPLLARKLPILIEASLVIADPQVRALGTLGGNVANGDPGNDMPAVMMCLDATYEVKGAAGERRIAARDFYQGAYVTALKPGEIIIAIRVPTPSAGHGYAYEKLKRKIGDYATAAAAVVLTIEGGRVSTCAIGLTNVADTPLLAEDAARALLGSSLEAGAIRKACAAAEAITAPASDTRGPPAYRAKMAGVMLARALARAQSRVDSAGERDVGS
jgi:aerobic carbon-monoxide dehydrogenase medium subunit